MALRFLRIEGITGDSAVTGHEGSIRVASWNWSVSNKQGMVTGAGSGHAVLHDLVVTAASGRANSTHRNMRVGRQPATASLTGVRGDSELSMFLRYYLSRVSIETVTQKIETVARWWIKPSCSSAG